ncbi:MAG: ion transporter [Cocleimonas sp.]|nr:ion transporter [Cocleimonas sp.]
MKLAPLQSKFLQLRNHALFQGIVITVIVFSALMIGVQTYDGIPQWIIKIITVLDLLITIFFLIEIIIRLISSKNIKEFLKDPWNIFDSIIVITSLIPLEGSETVLLGRLLRIFRVLRLISIIPELRVLLNAFFTAIPRMGYVSLLMFIIFYIYAAVGSIIFSDINQELWGNISISMLTLFRIATFEGWTEVMYETMKVYPLSWFYYLTFIFIVAFVFLNMMIGIVVETLQEEHEKESLESGEGESAEVHWIKEHTGMMEKRLERIEKLLEAQANPSEKVQSVRKD